MLYVKSPDKHALIVISYHIEFLTTLYFGQSQIDYSHFCFRVDSQLKDIKSKKKKDMKNCLSSVLRGMDIYVHVN